MRMDWVQALQLLLVGVAAGVASGLFGIGGGLIMIPIFTVFMRMNPHRASATSLAIVVLPIALPAVWNYHKAGEVDWQVVIWVALGFVVSNIFGSKLNMSLDDQLLRRLFAVFLLLAAMNLWMKPSKKAARLPGPSGVASVEQNRR
jgi:uncharacterized membrane protein YfcA